MSQDTRALRHVYYAIYLQVFLGISILGAAILETEIPIPLAEPKVTGCMLIFLALNAVLYLNKYKKAVQGNR